MVTSCCVKGCKEVYIKGGSITFHSIPRNEKRRKMWAAALRRESLPKTVSICSKHFQEKCFNRNKFGGTWLNEDATPTELLFVRSSVSMESTSSCNTGPLQSMKTNDVNSLSSFNNETESPLELTTTQDLRAFVDLKKDAEQFQIKFDAGIKECLSFLDAKIAAFICDHDSFGASRKSIHQNVVTDFSNLKYDIYTGIESVINGKEREWINYIAEMKKLFIENVKIFLAETKSEVTFLPSKTAVPYGPSVNSQKRKRYSYVGDFTDEDVGSPTKMQKLLELSHSKVKGFKRTLKSLKQKNKRYQTKMKTLKDIIWKLKKEKLITTTASSVLKKCKERKPPTKRVSSIEIPNQDDVSSVVGTNSEFQQNSSVVSDGLTSSSTESSFASRNPTTDALSNEITLLKRKIKELEEALESEKKKVTSPAPKGYTLQKKKNQQPITVIRRIKRKESN